MGLDGHLYRTSKRRLEAAKKFNQLREDFLKAGKALMEKPKWKTFLDSLPKTERGGCDYSKMTKEQKKGAAQVRRAIRRVAKKYGLKLTLSFEPIFDIEDFGLNHENDDLEEIGYWRKDWDLHRYIINHFGDPNNDNMVEVHFTKSDLEKIVADGYAGAFKKALDRWNDDYVVFYWPWY